MNTNYTNQDNITIQDNQIFIELASIEQSFTPVNSMRLLVDTGAFIALLNRKVANMNEYKIIEEKAFTIGGFNRAELEKYKQDIRLFGDKAQKPGIVCDLRLIPVAVFCGFKIDRLYIATPHDDIPVTEVLGMNVLENFLFGFDFDNKLFYAAKRANFDSQKPRYRCGNVSVMTTSNDIKSLTVTNLQPLGSQLPNIFSSDEEKESAMPKWLDDGYTSLCSPQCQQRQQRQHRPRPPKRHRTPIRNTRLRSERNYYGTHVCHLHHCTVEDLRRFHVHIANKKRLPGLKFGWALFICRETGKEVYCERYFSVMR